MRKEVKVLGLSYSQSTAGSYVIVLSEKKGKTKLPIVIKPTEAQQIAIKIEGLKSNRPTTQDLFKSLTDSYEIDIQEVYIYSILEGIFYTKLITSDGLEDIELECSVSDGITLSIVYDCPLYASKEVLDISGVRINDDGTSLTDEDDDEDDYEDDYEDGDDKVGMLSINDLEQMIEDAIEAEEYEIAAELRDRIEQIKKESGE